MSDQLCRWGKAKKESVDLWASVGFKPRYWGPPEPWSHGALLWALWSMWCAPPIVLPPISNFVYQGNQAPSASQGKQKKLAPSKSSALTEPKKRKMAEVTSGSQPKAGSATALSCPINTSKRDPQTQAVQFQTAKRNKSFARLNRKAQLYQPTMKSGLPQPTLL
jgi:hypothetical protein